MIVEVRVLGPVGLAAMDETSAEQSKMAPALGRAQRRLLARLCVSAGQVVSTERLAADLELASEGAVRTTVSRLRKSVGELIVRQPPGYYVRQGSVDTHRFAAVLAAARMAEPVEAIDLYDAALGMWHGTALVEFADQEWARAEAIRLDELRHAAQEERIEALIESGRFEDATADAERLVRDQPLRERRRSQLMRSLTQQGRRTEALRAYQEFRDYLAEEIGVDPSRELIDLEAQVVAGTLPAAHASAARESAGGAGDAATRRPTGQVTFLFTDVQGSSALWEKDPNAMNAGLEEHDRRIRHAIGKCNGYIFTTAGDSFSAAFSVPEEALRAAIAIQLALGTPAAGLKISVRIGLHSGVATERDGDYFGPVLNRCARLMDAGHGGQVLLSEVTAELIRDQIEMVPQLMGLVLTDLGKHELKDLSRPEHVYQLSHPSMPDTFPALRTADVVVGTLPIQLTSFVGREAELRAVAELLASARLVTLAGPGGGGKTRLALEAAAAAAHNYSGGVGLVELAPIADPHLVADAVAAAFGVTAMPDTPVETAIAAKVGGRDVLLLIDNCEHLVAGVASLVGELLKIAPGLRVLLTSQSLLGIGGETVYRVPPLTIPDDGSAFDEALVSDAVSLFRARAVSAKPTFTVDRKNVEAVVSLCRHLDGIPLALELAAARVKILAPDQIVQRLEQRFRLLSGASRSVDRHQSLQATIDWSHNLLPDAEKVLFRRCAVFSGSFSLEAVEAVAADDEVDQFEILDLLSALVDKSLVIVDDASGQSRFRMLESMREYARGRLDASPDSATAAQLHLAYFADLSEGLLLQARNGDLVDALEGMRVERDNVRLALDTGLRDGHHELVARIIGGIGHLWYIDGAFREGIDWCARLFVLEPDLSTTVMASVLHSYGSLLGSWAEPEAGAEMLERQVVLRRELGEPLRLAAALNNLGSIWTEVGRRVEGEAALSEAVEIYRSERVSPALAIIGLGWSRLRAGDYEEADVYYREALGEAQTANDSYDLALTTLMMGQCAAHLGQFVQARLLLEEGRNRFVEIGVVPGVQDADLHLALVERAAGHKRETASRLLAALEEPDSHWTSSGKFWVVQVAASIFEDRALAAEIIGFLRRYYDSLTGSQPVFVRVDIEATSAELLRELGDEFAHRSDVGERLTHHEVVTITRASLAVIREM
jgi:predicted ATPase/class 3 adenylate cyclase